ncbi:MAG TPA: hypothetical protein RMH85_05905 [Polyangiaceae bacterium LLY-WYZ-15_(1-7)]|nr:hypothetical protein [Myxococcales bacterium]MAT28894.1 hypothetical protein [Sandaracinus sp.]HJK94481.1 hypothetical protein [Polyangiaceae bacterium LLY-WYZ-15_(1-7)]MBJ70694.1 hypothetical protein [Sandaracinus sp.]HJL01748.1 hypothetical protein [Polyangiaceae bacterium LLY-WYZ-15_(1-7)]
MTRSHAALALVAGIALLGAGLWMVPADAESVAPPGPRAVWRDGGVMPDGAPSLLDANVVGPPEELPEPPDAGAPEEPDEDAPGDGDDAPDDGAPNSPR